MSQLGYAIVKKSIGGQEYRFRFYLGFPSAIEFRAPGTTDFVEVYRQNCIFEVGSQPQKKCTLTVTGPNALNVELDIDENVTPKIRKFDLELRDQDGTPGPTDNPAVKGRSGRDARVRRIVVDPPANGGSGGVEGYQSGDGGTVRVNNEGNTCPPDC